MKYHEIPRYTNFLYYFENIKIPMLRKREKIKKNNCGNKRRHILIVALTSGPECYNMAAFTRDLSMK